MANHKLKAEGSEQKAAAACSCRLPPSAFRLLHSPRLLLCALCVSAVLTAGCGRKSPPAAPEAAFQPPTCRGDILLAPEPRFTRAGRPVLGPGPAGSWDAVDVMNPTLAEGAGRLLMLYSGFDGRLWRTGLAVSTDGAKWEKRPGPVLESSPSGWDSEYIAANGSALFFKGKFYYWYQGGRDDRVRIGLATSADGERWTKHPGPVLAAGPPGAWDSEAVADPFVLACGETLFLYYLGQDQKQVQRLGVASSADGIHWTRYGRNPVLDVSRGFFDERGLGEPAVIPVAGGSAMFYTGRDAREFRRIGLALSPDGLAWRKAGVALDVAPSGWDSRVVADPHVMAAGNRLLLYYGGGDVASPDENLHGRIGLATAPVERGFRLEFAEASVRPAEPRGDTPNGRWAFPYEKDSLVTLARAAATFSIEVPPKARFRAAVAMPLAGAGPARALVRIDRHEVFSREVSAGANRAVPPSRMSERFVEIDLDLAPYAGKKVQLELAALPGPGGERGSWVQWRNPRIVKESKP